MNILYDLILTGIVGAMFASLYGAAWLVHKAWTRPTKGNPFRQFKDWQLRGILRNDNCVVCCTVCNSVKGATLTYDEMLLLREGLTEIAKQRTQNAHEA